MGRKPRINEDAYIGCGLCVSHCSAFRFNDRGTVEWCDGIAYSHAEIQKIINHSDVLKCITWN